MRTLRLFVLALFFAAPLSGAAISGPAEIPALPPSASVAASLGSALGGQVLQTAGGISLRSPALTLASLAQLRQSFPKISDPQLKAAAIAVMGAIAQPAVLEQRLKTSDLPAAAVKRLAAISDKLDAAAKKSPELARQVAAERSAGAALVALTAAHPGALPADLLPTLRAFLQWGQVTDDPGPSEPVEPAPQGQDWSQVDAKTLLDPTKRPTVSFGTEKLPVLAMPTLGDNIADLWTSANAQNDKSQPVLMAMYNFDDMDIANAIVAASKKGQKYIIVGDYSNWFPDRMPAAIEQAKKNGTPLPQQTEAMKFVIANLNSNIDLHILKGIGEEGINHNKFTLWTAADAQELLQSGSFNYTKTSQLNHWENVVFTDDADRIAFFKKYHAWLVRRARKYSPDLQPEDPVMDPKDPIPQDPSRSIVFHGVPFPKVSASPIGGTEDWLVKAMELVKATHDTIMFSPFPTPKMSAAIEAELAKAVAARMIADRGEISDAGAALIPLMDKGEKLKTIVGPDVVLHHQPYTEHSKQHMKVDIFDGHSPDAMAKGGDSLNYSGNALNHNFEITQFWQGFIPAFLQAYFNYMWPLAEDLTQELLTKLRNESEHHASPTDPSPADVKPAPPAPGKAPSKAPSKRAS